MDVMVTVCDICRKTDTPTRSYVLASEGRLAELDLCAEHAGPMEELLRHQAPTEQPVETGHKEPEVQHRRRRGGVQVVSLEEIEEKKREWQSEAS